MINSVPSIAFVGASAPRFVGDRTARRSSAPIPPANTARASPAYQVQLLEKQKLRAINGMRGRDAD
jgi:hypothetical protein